MKQAINLTNNRSNNCNGYIASNGIPNGIPNGYVATDKGYISVGASASASAGSALPHASTDANADAAALTLVEWQY